MTRCPSPGLPTFSSSATSSSALRGLTSLAVLAALAACGGGGSSDSPPAPAPPPVAVAPPPPAALTVGGTAATGAAMAAAAVQIKCVGGNGTATTGADGVYSVAITGASLPCVLSVSSGSTTLRSVAEAGTATTVTANISPLSEIIAAHLAGGNAAALFTTFDAAAQAKLTSAGLTAARTAVGNALQGAVDLTGIDPIKDVLTIGNPLDKKLDALGAALKAGGVSVADVVAALAANPAAPAVVQTLLQPAATSCAALRSGNYRAIDPGNLLSPFGRVKIDAVGLSFTNSGGTAYAMTPSTTDGACVFTLNSGIARAYVSRGGLVLLRYAPPGEPVGVALLVPEQTVPIAEALGNWNMGYYGAATFNGPDGSSYNTLTFDVAGKLTAGADCEGISACVPWTPLATDVLVAQADGGFKHSSPDGTSARFFVVKSAAGAIASFGIRSDAQGRPLGVLFGSKANVLTLPAVGEVTRFWDLSFTSTGPGTVVDSQVTVKTVDTAALSYTRERLADGRIDSFTLNKPQPGMRYRAAGTGGNVSYGAVVAAPLAGMGLTVTASVNQGTASSFFNVSVLKP